MDIGGDEMRRLEKGECQGRTCHDIGKRKAALTDMPRDDLCQLSLAEMDVEICGCCDPDRVGHGRRSASSFRA